MSLYNLASGELKKENKRLKEEYRITCEQKNDYISKLEGSLGIAEERCLKLENIIKEVREYFKNHTLKYDDLMLIKPSDVLGILDKEK